MRVFFFERDGTLIQINGIMITDKYIDTINKNLEMAVVKMSLDKEFVLQHDND